MKTKRSGKVQMKKRRRLCLLLILSLIFGMMPDMSMTVRADGNYLTFTGTDSFTIKTCNSLKNWNGTLEYSTDASDWTEWNGTEISSAGNKLYLRGTGNTKITGGYNKGWQITSEGTVACSGDIRTLLNYSSPATSIMDGICFESLFEDCTSLTAAPSLPATTLAYCCYSAMFYGCTSLSTAPSLPATTLANYCYNGMFSGCTSLSAAPSLPATTLANYCYNGMFSGCTSLSAAPELPATTLAEGCYSSMFKNCTGLTVTPSLPATTLSEWCYSEMFSECTNLTTALELPATTLAERCYTDMFTGCTSLTTAPSLPATTLANYCYNGMFSGCTGLTAAPSLPATTLSEWCYSEMFKGCTSLTNAPSLSATMLAESCYSEMFNGCTGLTAAPSLPATTLASGCYSEMLNGCTGLTTAPSLPATTLARGCYGKMFYGCTNLTAAPALPATTLAGGCYSEMFNGCTSLTTAPELPATTLTEVCYGGMFNGCTGLTTAPSLPATTLTNDCYGGMFTGCTGLTAAPSLPATTLAENCYREMFNGCTGLTTAPSLPATTLAENCYLEMFKGCTSLTTAPELPATTLADNCYSFMFSDCTSLTTAPELPATILADSCYRSMFWGCTSLMLSETQGGIYDTVYRIPSGGQGVMAPYALEYMFSCTGGSFSGTPDINTTYYMKAGKYLTFTGTDEFIVKTANESKNWNGTLEYSTNATSWNVWDGTEISSADNVLYLRGTGNTKITGGNNKGWQITSEGTVACSGDIRTLLNYSSPATSIMDGECFKSLFKDCASLTAAPSLPATTLAEGCYENMFSGCINLTDIPSLPATTLAESCYDSMFSGCTNLAATPILPATTLADNCYNSMFSGCTSLTQVPELPATTLADGCYSNMFSDCTGLMISDTRTGVYNAEYRIPSDGVGITADNALDGMFAGTGGTFTGTPDINRAYYIIKPCSVTIKGGGNAVAGGGKTSQSGFEGAMTPVIYTADSNYHFADFEPILCNGITVQKTSDTEVTVSGTPSSDTEITVPDAELIRYSVTYKVAGGTWADGTTADKSEEVAYGSKPAGVPAGMMAASGYTGGAWDTDPTAVTITEAKTFTYSFTAESQPDPEPEPEPEPNPEPQPQPDPEPQPEPEPEPQPQPEPETKTEPESEAEPEAEAEPETEQPVHVHALVHHGRVEATEETEGNIEYWECTECKKLYADADATKEISAEDIVIPKLKPKTERPAPAEPVTVTEKIGEVPVTIDTDVTYPEAVSWTGKKITKEQLAILADSGEIAKVDIKGLAEAVKTLKPETDVSKLYKLSYQISRDKDVSSGKAYFTVKLTLKNTALKKAGIKGADKKALKQLVKTLNGQLKEKKYYFDIVPIKLKDTESITIRAKLKNGQLDADEDGTLKGLKSLKIKVKISGVKDTKPYSYSAKKAAKSFVIKVTDPAAGTVELSAKDGSGFAGTMTGIKPEK